MLQARAHGGQWTDWSPSEGCQFASSPEVRTLGLEECVRVSEKLYSQSLRAIPAATGSSAPRGQPQAKDTGTEALAAFQGVVIRASEVPPSWLQGKYSNIVIAGQEQTQMSYTQARDPKTRNPKPYKGECGQCFRNVGSAPVPR